jgi:cytoskeleton protein RodZ
MTKVTRLTIDEGGGAQSRRIHLREISGDMDAPLETVGQDLRTARLRRGDDLASVSRVLKIRRDHLEALEEDRLEALPGRTYAVGFVRSYAEYLGLDVNQCVERFKAEIAGRAEQGTPVQVIEEDEHRRLPQGWKLIAGVVFLLLLYGAYHLIVLADDALTQPSTPPPPQAMVTKPKPAPRHVAAIPQQAPTTAAPSTAMGTTVPNQTAATGSTTTAPIAVGPGTLPAPSVTGTVPNGGTSTPTVVYPGAPPAATQFAALPPGHIYGTKNHDARVVLRIHAPTRLLVLGPKKVVLINQTLQPGDAYQVPNVVGLTLTTPNGGAVELDLDGAPMGFAGRDQQMTEDLSLDPQAIVDRYNGVRG